MLECCYNRLQVKEGSTITAVMHSFKGISCISYMFMALPCSVTQKTLNKATQYNPRL